MKSIAMIARLSAVSAMLLAMGLVDGCAAGGGGGGPAGAVDFSVETGAAGDIELTETEPGRFEGRGIDRADLGGQAPPNATRGTASMRDRNIQLLVERDGEEAEAPQALITVHIAPADADEPCADEDIALDFTATQDAGGAITLDGTTERELAGEVLRAVAGNNFVFCIDVEANFPGTVNVAAVDITLQGGAAPADGGDGDFFTCDSPGGEDHGAEFGQAGTTKIIASTIGEGRHMVLTDD